MGITTLLHRVVVEETPLSEDPVSIQHHMLALYSWMAEVAEGAAPGRPAYIPSKEKH